MTRNVGFPIGAGYAGEEILRKEPLIRALTGHRVHAASRIDPEVHLRARGGLPVRNLPVETLRASFEKLGKHAASFDVVYRSPHFQKHYSTQEIEELQAWLGRSFAYIASMDRRFFTPATLRDERDPAVVFQAVAAYVAYFRDWFQRHQIEVYVTTLEDDLFSLVPYFVAKRLGTYIISWQVGRFPLRGAIFCHDFRELLLWNDDVAEWSQIAPLYQERTTSGEALARTQGYWDVASFPRRVRDAAFAGPFGSYRETAVRAYPAEAAIIPPVRLARQAGRYLRKVARRYGMQAFTALPPPGEPYFLYAIHMLEDAQITFREPQLDQFQLIKQIARAMPYGPKLYVKPHPHYYGTDMSLGEIARLARMPNVRILPATVPPTKLIREAAGIVTVNSTVGFEALAHGTPVVTVGTDFYCIEPYCRVVHDRNRLSDALARVYARAEPPDVEANRLFVRKAYSNTVRVDGVDHGFAFYGYTDDDGKRVAHALDRILARHLGPAA